MTAMGNRRLTFLNVSSFQVLVMFRRGMFYAYLSIYLRHFLGLSVTETTLFASLSMIVNVLFQSFLWGRISDRLQLRRTLIIIGEILAAIITFAVWFVHTLPDDTRMAGWVIIIGMAVVEIFWSMSNLGWSALLSDLYPEGGRAGLQGRMQSVGAVGRIVGIWVGGLLYDGLSLHYPGWGFEHGTLFFIASGVMLISSIPMFFVPEGGISREESGATAGSQGTGADVAAVKSASRQYLVFLVAMVFINFGLNSVVILKSQYLSLPEGFAISSRTLSYILNMGSAASFIVGLSVTGLSRRYSDEAILLFSTLLAIVHLWIFVFAATLLPIYLSEAIGGAARVLIVASSYSHAARLIPPERRARQFAWFNATMFLSWGVPGTLITGPIVDGLIASGATHAYAYQMSFLTAGGMGIVGALVLLYSYRVKRRQAVVSS